MPLGAFISGGVKGWSGGTFSSVVCPIPIVSKVVIVRIGCGRGPVVGITSGDVRWSCGFLWRFWSAVASGVEGEVAGLVGVVVAGGEADDAVDASGGVVEGESEPIISNGIAYWERNSDGS